MGNKSEYDITARRKVRFYQNMDCYRKQNEKPKMASYRREEHSLCIDTEKTIEEEEINRKTIKTKR